MYLENACRLVAAHIEILHVPPRITKAFFNLLYCMM